MSEAKTQPTAADRLQELQKLNSQREGLVRRQAVLEAQHQQAERELAALVLEMKDAGTSPETIDVDVVQAGGVLTSSMGKYQEDLDRFRTIIETAETNLK